MCHTMSKALKAYIIHIRVLPDGSVHVCGMGVQLYVLVLFLCVRHLPTEG